MYSTPTQCMRKQFHTDFGPSILNGLVSNCRSSFCSIAELLIDTGSSIGFGPEFFGSRWLQANPIYRLFPPLILKTLSQLASLQGDGIVMHIRRVTDEQLIVEEGSLYPAFHRVEQNGGVRASWAVTDYGRNGNRAFQ